MISWQTVEEHDYESRSTQPIKKIQYNTMDSIRHYNKDAIEILDNETEIEKWTLAKDDGRR